MVNLLPMNNSHQDKPKTQSARVRRKRALIRDEILTTATHLLHEGGVDTITLAAVAIRLDLTKQAIYHYFPSKESLLKNLITRILNDEIMAVETAVKESGDDSKVLGVMIRAYYDHYIHQLEAFRAVYCQSQLLPASHLGLDEKMVREEINPLTRQLFDLLESRLIDDGATKAVRKRMRRLSFSAWLAALGLLTMLSIADANNDPLVHNDRDLLNTLSDVFNSAAKNA